MNCKKECHAVQHKELFIQAIHSRKKIKLTFFSKEDNKVITCVCAPMDFGQSKVFNDNIDRFHVWNYSPDLGKEQHPIPLNPSQVKKIEVLEETFDPAEFIKWDFVPSSWHVRRDWGRFS